MAPTQTAVVVAVPAAEPLVAAHRGRFDPSSSWGVPAHVTVLYPFVHPSALDSDAVRRLGEAVASIVSFDVGFERCCWFGEDVLWLEPLPADPFRQLTEAVHRAFPDHPPYGGAHPDVVPHLTIGQRPEADVAQLREAERAVVRGLPLTAAVHHVQLIAGTTAPDSWQVVHELPLATVHGPPSSG